MTFLTSYTIINIKDRTNSLEEIYFPSLVICNINPLKKSFIYWLHEEHGKSGKTNASISEIFDMVGNLYFSSENTDKKSQDKYDRILDNILESEFFEKKFKEFMEEKINGSDFTITPKTNTPFIYNRVEDAAEDLGEYNEVTKKNYHKNFLRELAGQWKQGQ